MDQQPSCYAPLRVRSNRASSTTKTVGITGNLLKDRAQYRTRTKYDDDGAMGGSRTRFVHLVLFTCRLFGLCFFAALLLFLDIVTKCCQMGVFSLRSPLCFDCPSQMGQSRIALLQRQDFLQKTVSKSHSRNCWTTVPILQVFPSEPIHVVAVPFFFFWSVRLLLRFGIPSCQRLRRAAVMCTVLPTSVSHSFTVPLPLSIAPAHVTSMPTSRSKTLFWTFHSPLALHQM